MDNKILIIWLGIIIFVSILATLDLFIDNIRYKKIFKKYPSLKKDIDDYYYWINKQADYYNTYIAPVQKRIDNIRNKIPTATINEYKQYSDDIERLEKTIEDYKKKNQEYTIKALYSKRFVLEAIHTMNKKDRKVFKNYQYNSF